MLSTVYLYLWVPVNFQNVFIVARVSRKYLMLAINLVLSFCFGVRP